MKKSTEDRGLYVVWFELDAPVHTLVGTLGEGTFSPGLYAYVGSAQRHRTARIRRHLRKEKPRRWHIDYLLPSGNPVAVTLCDGEKERECQLVQELVDLLGARRAFPRFGASDCRCEGHLLGLPMVPRFVLTSRVDGALRAVTIDPGELIAFDS